VERRDKKMREREKREDCIPENDLHLLKVQVISYHLGCNFQMTRIRESVFH